METTLKELNTYDHLTTLKRRWKNIDNANWINFTFSTLKQGWYTLSISSTIFQRWIDVDAILRFRVKSTSYRCLFANIEPTFVKRQNTIDITLSTSTYFNFVITELCPLGRILRKCCNSRKVYALTCKNTW